MSDCERSLNPGLLGLYWGSDEPIAIPEWDTDYEVLHGMERDSVILDALKKRAPVVGMDRQPNWEAAWMERLEAYRETGDAVDLIPRYYLPSSKPLRLGRRFILPRSPDFLLRYVTGFCQWIFEKYLAPYDNIYEFGCGTGWNLIALRKMFPDKGLLGLDWSQASMEILSLLGIDHYRHDLARDPFIWNGQHDAAVTIGALEQIGHRWESFLASLLHSKVGIVVNIEPLYELYEPNYLLDYLAMEYHERRGYLAGYLPKLQELEVKGQIEILKVHHHFFGNVYNDSFSYVIWRCK